MNVARTLQRFQILEAARELPGKIAVADVHKYLHAANLGSLTLQTMVFEPATLQLHLAVGEIPASRGALKTLELGPLFKGE